MQLDLFNTSEKNTSKLTKKATKEKKLDFPTWSFSKLDTLKQCSRKYYYQYFGSKKSKAKNDPFKQELMFLARLQNKYLLLGEIIHHVIKTYLTKARSGEIWSEDRLINWAIKRYTDSLLFSKQYVTDPTSLPKMDYPPALLKEVIFGLQSVESLREEGTSKIYESLKNFSTSEEFSLLRMGGMQEEALLEKKAKFSFGQHISVSGMIDIAFPNDGKLIIADWKTGKADIKETSLQLLAYAWWAILNLDYKWTSVIIQKAFLPENKVENLEFSEIHLARAKARIIQDVELISHYEALGNDGNYQAFSKVEHEKVCNLCPFQKICTQSI